MNRNTQFFIGIDISKPWFDASLLPMIEYQKGIMVSERFNNDATGLTMFLKWLKKYKVPLDENSLLVIENTGIYHRLLWSFCSKHKLPIHIGNAAHIKKCFGIARGKNDKIDSQRLCDYARKHCEDIKATTALNPVLMQLKDLMTARTKLLAQVNSTKTYIKELKNVSDAKIKK